MSLPLTFSHPLILLSFCHFSVFSLQMIINNLASRSTVPPSSRSYSRKAALSLRVPVLIARYRGSVAPRAHGTHISFVFADHQATRHQVTGFSSRVACSSPSAGVPTIAIQRSPALSPFDSPVDVGDLWCHRCDVQFRPYHVTQTLSMQRFNSCRAFDRRFLFPLALFFHLTMSMSTARPCESQ